MWKAFCANTSQKICAPVVLNELKCVVSSTVDNSTIVLTLMFRSVSIPSLQNDSTILWPVFHAFYGNKQEWLYNVRVHQNGTIRGTMEQLCAGKQFGVHCST